MQLLAISQRLRVALTSGSVVYAPETMFGPPMPKVKKKMGRPMGSKNKFRVDGPLGYQITDQSIKLEKEAEEAAKIMR